MRHLSLFLLSFFAFSNSSRVSADPPLEYSSLDQCPILTIKTSRGYGTGWVIGKNRVLTAWHVVNNDSPERAVYEDPIGAIPTSVWIDDEYKKVEIIYIPSFQKSDLALLKVHTGNLPVLQLADSEPNLNEALTWYRQNCSERFTGAYQGSMRDRIHSTHKHGSLFIFYRIFEQEFIMAGKENSDTAIRGSSGSPILNENGKVVGVMTTVWGWGPSLSEIRSFLKKYGYYKENIN